MLGVDLRCGISCSAAINPCGSPCSTTECSCGNLCLTTVGDNGDFCSITALSRGDSCLTTSLVLETPFSATIQLFGIPCLSTMVADRKSISTSEFFSGSPCSTISLRVRVPARPRRPRAGATAHSRRFFLRSEKYLLLMFKRTAQVKQRRSSLALCSACVADELSTTVTLGHLLGETKGWVNTLLTSNLRRRFTDLASQSIWCL